MNTSIFLDINRLAEHSSWAHPVFEALAGTVGLVVVVALLLAGLAHAGWRRSRASARLAAGSLAAVLLALGLGEAISHLLNRPRPFAALSGIEVLGAHPGGSPLPDLHATLAGAVLVVLFVLGERALGAVAAPVALLVAFAGIYVGAYFPTDALVGLLLGAAVAVFAIPLVHRRGDGVDVGRVPTSLSGDLAALARPIAGAGPAAHPVPIAATGSVRLLETGSERGDAGLPPPRRVDAPLPAPRPGRAVSIFPAPPQRSGEPPAE